MTPVSGIWAVTRSSAPADTDDIDDRLPSRALWRDLAGAAACVVLGVLGFTGDGRVPVLVWINLAIHEFGHVATYAFPEVVTAMMGSITQVAAAAGDRRVLPPPARAGLGDALPRLGRDVGARGRRSTSATPRTSASS